MTEREKERVWIENKVKQEGNFKLQWISETASQDQQRNLTTAEVTVASAWLVWTWRRECTRRFAQGRRFWWILQFPVREERRKKTRYNETILIIKLKLIPTHNNTTTNSKWKS